jgi:uncharacterized protein DUF4276
MTVEHVEVLVEEPSMEAALRVILPRIVGQLSHEIYPYQCKQDLLARLPQRLLGYASWLPPNWRVVVILDRDDDDCRELKIGLDKIALDAGLRTRATAAEGEYYSLINRLAIEELEAWYFGDWTAVRTAFPRVPTSIPDKAKYRNCDAITGGTWEAFERIMQRAGYFDSGLRKIEAARLIADHMDPDRNASRSFQSFRAAFEQMTSCTD